MATDNAPAALIVERLSDALALITAAQGMLRGQLPAGMFAQQVQRTAQAYADPVDALTHMALASAQVLRAAGSTTPDAALSKTGIALAAYAMPGPGGTGSA